jgi:SAM-dependent methyltransferase
MRPAGPDWRFRCPQCGTQSSSLDITINASHAIDEEQREGGLEALRRRNNGEILRRLTDWEVARPSRLLDVGCAHGWFMSAATAAGIEATGIEPDVAIASQAIALGHDVRVGYFPDALRDGETFGVITFNDVLEHLPDPRAALEEAARRLDPGGLLVVNMPDRSGIVYRLASLARSVGVASVFERLWQVGLPSPHLWYLDRRGLVALAESIGLTCVSAAHLPSIDRRGLWARAHFDRPPSPITVLSVGLGWVAAPVLNSERFSDIMLVALRKPA